VKRLLIASAFLVVLSGCGLGIDRDVRAYNTCLSRHPQDVVVCEGPRQAYEIDPSIVRARSAGAGPAAGDSYAAGSVLSGSSPLNPVHPGPMPAASGPNG
jgi:hypothetical protein